MCAPINREIASIGGGVLGVWNPDNPKPGQAGRAPVFHPERLKSGVWNP